MDNSKNMEPGIRNTTVQDSPNKEQRKRESRVSIRFTTYFLEVFENIWDKIWRN